MRYSVQLFTTEQNFRLVQIESTSQQQNKCNSSIERFLLAPLRKSAFDNYVGKGENASKFS